MAKNNSTPETPNPPPEKDKNENSLFTVETLQSSTFHTIPVVNVILKPDKNNPFGKDNPQARLVLANMQYGEMRPKVGATVEVKFSVK